MFHDYDPTQLPNLWGLAVFVVSFFGWAIWINYQDNKKAKERAKRNELKNKQ